MSGGSFEYLYTAWVDEYLNRQRELEAMAQWLAEHGYEDAAKETYDLLHDVRAASVRWQSHLKRLEGVWKAVEWTVSGDSRMDAVDEAIAKYRGVTS